MVPGFDTAEVGSRIENLESRITSSISMVRAVVKNLMFKAQGMCLGCILGLVGKGDGCNPRPLTLHPIPITHNP